VLTEKPLSPRICGTYAEPDSWGAMTVKEIFFGCLDWDGILNVLTPTHTPPPLSRPAGRNRGASCGRVFEGGKFVLDCTLASKWALCTHEALKPIPAQRQLTFKRFQQIERPLNHFDGNAPMRTFFPPLKTRPNVAVSSLSAPAGVERVGERGGMQHIKNKSAANHQEAES
jgi:hypothetical protein